MMFKRAVLALISSLSFVGPACDSSSGGADGTHGDPATGCNLSFAVRNVNGKGFGEGCTTDAECMYGECMMPGDPGNDTNSVFGFCTRGCDCQNATDSQIPNDLSEVLECRYPTDGVGTFKAYHHVVVECSSGDLAMCQALDSRWTECYLPSTGGARKVCGAEHLDDL